MKNSWLTVLFCLFFFPKSTGQNLFRENSEAEYRILLEGGYSLGRGNDASNDYNFTFSNGLYLGVLPSLYLGAGTGVICYTALKKVMIPAFAHIRFNLRDEFPLPFADFRIGYSFGDYAGLYISPSFGVKIRIISDCDLCVSVGYTFQRAFESDFDEYNIYQRILFDQLHSINFKIGFEF